MIVFWILGGIFIIVGFIMGVRKFIKTYQYRGKAEGVILDYESSTGTGKQSIRVRYQYVISGVKYVAKSEWLNNGSFYPGKKCEVRYNTGKPEKSYLKMFDRVLQSVIATIFFLLGGVIIILGIILSGIMSI